MLLRGISGATSLLTPDAPSIATPAACPTSPIYFHRVVPTQNQNNHGRSHIDREPLEGAVVLRRIHNAGLPEVHGEEEVIT